MKNQKPLNGILSPLLQKIRIKKALPYITGKHILDVGSSEGEILRYLPHDVDYIGIEGNTACCKIAQKIYPQHNFINLYLNVYNCDNLNISERDTILMLGILEHLAQPVEILKKLKKYLSGEGNIIITTPSNYTKWILKTGARFRMFSSDKHEHKNHFSEYELKRICENAGTSIIHYSRFEFRLNHLIVLRQ